MNLLDSFDEVLSSEEHFEKFSKFKIEIKIQKSRFSLVDNCGGIEYKAAKETIFQFGRQAVTDHKDTLSVYGIGLKRALFKIGDQISFKSRRDGDAFEVAFSAKEWQGKEEWLLPLERISPAALHGDGTAISVTDMSSEVIERISSPDFTASLSRRIKETYCFYVGRFCKISVNGEDVPAQPIELGAEKVLSPAVQRLKENDVVTIVVAGLAPRRDDSPRPNPCGRNHYGR